MPKTPVQFRSTQVNPGAPGVKDVAPSEVCEKGGALRLIDVRRPDEFAGELGHIVGAELIALDRFPEALDELSKDETIVFICRSGGRSARACAIAQERGFQTVFNMQGGMLLWNELGLPIER